MSDKKIYGLIGYPVKHSFSAAMHNAAFLHLGMNAEYKLFEVRPEELEDFLLNRKDVECFNATIPHKVKAMEFLESNFPYKKNDPRIQTNLQDAILTGAVNTVKREEGKALYWNTDAEGFVRSLENDLSFELGIGYRNVLLFGCGGAGRAVISGLSWEQHKVEKIYVFDKNKEMVELFTEHCAHLPGIWPKMLKEKIEFILEEQIAECIKKSDLLVNASPVGMKEGDGSMVDNELLHKGLSVYDVVYNRQTQLVKDAKEKGLAAVGGLGMLLYQGVIAFELWTNTKAPEEVMRKALQKELEKKCRT
ncbi:MAG: shikimate dehydrogenase [Candidatus Omnitrophica bacterium]|nr:shikimate dehydrogenase [Candidatus Omnitrophota bacterium]